MALSPAMLVVVVVYVGCTAWTMWISLTASRMLPNSTFVGLRQYASLMGNERWQVSVVNLAVFGALFLAFSLVLGFLLAVMIDQRARGENVLRSIFLYPYSMSFIVTGLVWQWLLNPSFGIEKMGRD
ncbi:MAG: glucose/mannose transport system permease protein, partial [Rhodospirillaceae bacterium]|nr:glucose/mannose transport system permease protein [Rhodospirillaceae bacterium]